MTRTYYDVLGVARDADVERVRAAYRERVKTVHPDVSDRPDAAEQFRVLSTAKQVLCDPDERARYDRLGHDAYTTGERPQDSESAGTTPRTSDAESGAGEPGAAESGAREPGAAESGAGEPGAAESGAREPGAAESGAREPGAAEPGAGERDDPRQQRATDGDDRAANDEWRRRRRRSRRRAHAWASARNEWRDANARDHTTTTAANGATDTAGASGASTTDVSGASHAGSDGASWYRTGAGNTVNRTGYRVSPRTDSAAEFTAERGLLAVAVFICYPMLLGVAVLPVFGLLVRSAAAVCALLVVAQTLSVPESGVLVFGALTLAAPVGLGLAGIDVLSPEAVIAWAFCWIPFVIAVGNFLALRG